MKLTRALAAAGCGLLALVAVPASPRARQASAEQAPGRPAEYVVAYEGDAGAVRRAIVESGGTVEDVNDDLDVALARATGAGFPDRVLAERAVTSVVHNSSVGTAEPGQPHRFVHERPTAEDRAAAARRSAGADAGTVRPLNGAADAEPLADRQWDMDMIGATADDAHLEAAGRDVKVGVIDTGVDGSHPDIAPNFDAAGSRNFTTDIPEIDGPCEVPSCVDPATVDEGGHGTHVAGTVAAARNRLGIAGVAPEATIVNVRAGQDSGYFFLYETVNALTYAADAGLDVVNMSFYVDPWLYNCSSRGDYLGGTVSDEELEQQRLTRRLMTEALEYAHDRGVTLVAAAGNGHTDLAAPRRVDGSSPDYPEGSARPRTVSHECLDLPSEGPHVISVASVGPSGAKADYSNYGLGEVELSAPGGYLRDLFGTPQYQAPANMVLSSYPLSVARAEGLVDERDEPVDDFTVRSCDSQGRCGVYTYLQGTSMASPHVAGVAALAISAHGDRDAGGGLSLDPDDVASVLARSARDQACPVGGTVDYADEGRTADWTATCQGPPADNGFYGEGIVDASSAVALLA